MRFLNSPRFDKTAKSALALTLNVMVLAYWIAFKGLSFNLTLVIDPDFWISVYMLFAAISYAAYLAPQTREKASKNDLMRRLSRVALIPFIIYSFFLLVADQYLSAVIMLVLAVANYQISSESIAEKTVDAAEKKASITVLIVLFTIYCSIMTLILYVMSMLMNSEREKSFYISWSIMVGIPIAVMAVIKLWKMRKRSFEDKNI